MASADTFVNLGLPRCQKVLPLAYDDSLSYYEAICKMTNKVNELVDFIEEYEDTSNALLKALKETLPAFDTRLTKIENEFAGLDGIKANVAKLQKDVIDMQTKHTNDVLSLQTQLDAINVDFQTWNKKLERVYLYMSQELDRLERDYNFKFYQLRYDVNVMKAELEAQMDAINERIEYLIEHISYDVFNPVQGRRITFDQNNKYVYEDLGSSSATCGEIGARKIKISDVIKGNWTCRIWATKSREKITWYFNHGFSTVSGMFTSWGNAISELIGKMFDSMKCSEYTDKGVTCGYFTENGITIEQLWKLKVD